MQYDEIKRLIDDVGNSNIEDISLEFPDGLKINIKKKITENKENAIAPQSVVTKKEVNEDEYKIITSPVVGTFYSKSSPSASPYVRVGQNVKKGDVLCVIEAMKLMNEIESDCSGEIVEILVKDEEMVDYGKPLFKIKEVI